MSFLSWRCICANDRNFNTVPNCVIVTVACNARRPTNWAMKPNSAVLTATITRVFLSVSDLCDVMIVVAGQSLAKDPKS